MAHNEADIADAGATALYYHYTDNSLNIRERVEWLDFIYNEVVRDRNL
jgi:hypothetical protein